MEADGRLEEMGDTRTEEGLTRPHQGRDISSASNEGEAQEQYVVA